MLVAVLRLECDDGRLRFVRALSHQVVGAYRQHHFDHSEKRQPVERRRSAQGGPVA